LDDIDEEPINEEPIINKEPKIKNLPQTRKKRAEQESYEIQQKYIQEFEEEDLEKENFIAEGDLNFSRKELEKPDMDPIELTDILNTLKEENTSQIFVLDVSKKCSWTKYLITSLAQSERHAKSVVDTLEEKFGHKVRSQTDLNGRVEDKKPCEWCVFDAGSIHISVFTDQGREYYDLEKLWAMKHSLEISDALEQETILDSLEELEKVQKAEKKSKKMITKKKKK